MNVKLVSVRPLSLVTEMGEVCQIPQEAMQEVAVALGWRGFGEDEHDDPERFLSALVEAKATIKLTSTGRLPCLWSSIQ